MAQKTDHFAVVKTREISLAGITESQYNIFEILAMTPEGEIFTIDQRPCMLYDSDLEFTTLHCAEMNAWCLEYDMVPAYADGVARERAEIRNRDVGYIQELRARGFRPIEIARIIEGHRGF